jgi:hypothetical protein
MASIQSANDVYAHAEETAVDKNRARINSAVKVYSLARKSALQKYNSALKNFKREVKVFRGATSRAKF